MNITVYNTLTKRKEPFETVTPGKVGIYLCGPTVYRESHIGHMVGPVIFDTIKRYLAYCGFEVTLVINITDVDDKLIAESNKRRVTMAQVADEVTKDYLDNLAKLGVDSIDQMPKATENIGEIIKIIETLIKKGFAYDSEGDVYFEVGRDDEYGKLSNRTSESLRGEGGEAASRKRAPGDFALWKSSKPDEPSWDSPWGKGRPGWHIECSAMSRRILGETFDIHGGGLDLVFPHHENELAQSECCHDKPMVKYWMHNGLMRASSAAGKMGGRSDREQQADVNTKISRSKGAGGLADLIAAHGGETIRFFLLRTHYRSTIVYGEEGLQEAATALDNFYRFFERYERITGSSFYAITAAETREAGSGTAAEGSLLEETLQLRTDFLEKMDDDFNTGGGVSELFDLLRLLNKFADDNKLEEAGDVTKITSLTQAAGVLKELADILGLFRAKPETATGQDDQLVGQLVELLIEIRADARAQKDFATSDKVRDRLSEIGLTLEDRKGETTWRRDR